MFISTPDTAEAVAYMERERQETGYLMDVERAWAWRPDVAGGFAGLRKQLMGASTLSKREMALLVCATARTLGDSCCSLAWGARLARLSDATTAANVLRGADGGLSAREAALQRWTGQVVGDPNGATAEQIDELRKAGFSDREIAEATVLIAFRLAFSTVNDALGAQPDPEMVAEAPAEVRAAVTYGRPPLR